MKTSGLTLEQTVCEMMKTGTFTAFEQHLNEHLNCRGIVDTIYELVNGINTERYLIVYMNVCYGPKEIFCTVCLYDLKQKG